MNLKTLIALIVAAAVAILVAFTVTKKDSASWKTVEAGGLIFEDMSDAKLKAWIEMDRVLEIVNSQLSDPGEQWIIDESGTIDEAHIKNISV